MCDMDAAQSPHSRAQANGGFLGPTRDREREGQGHQRAEAGLLPRDGRHRLAP